MDSVWISDNTLHRDWFIHIGKGNNLRNAVMPSGLSLTKKMVHHFLTAPDDYSVNEAICWAQVNALQGRGYVAEGLRGTRLIDDIDNNEFWQSVIRFFIANPMLDKNQYGPIIDFIHFQKYEPQDIFVGPGQIERRPAPQPGFSMHGRSVDSLLNQMEGWHHELGRISEFKESNWKSSGLKGFHRVTGNKEKCNQVVWDITELLTSKELTAEGRAMNHCVGSYSRSCASGRNSIWSLSKTTSSGYEKLLTISVHNSKRQIDQARGQRNRRPDNSSRKIMEAWAKQENLSILNYV